LAVVSALAMAVVSVLAMTVVSAMAMAMALAVVLAVELALAVALVLQAPFASQMLQCHSARSSLDQTRGRVDRKSAVAENCRD
jgi:multisubunit Na+/H+ antiporter MnhG subunit